VFADVRRDAGGFLGPTNPKTTVGLECALERLESSFELAPLAEERDEHVEWAPPARGGFRFDAGREGAEHLVEAARRCVKPEPSTGFDPEFLRQWSARVTSHARQHSRGRVHASNLRSMSGAACSTFVPKRRTPGSTPCSAISTRFCSITPRASARRRPRA